MAHPLATLAAQRVARHLAANTKSKLPMLLGLLCALLLGGLLLIITPIIAITGCGPSSSGETTFIATDEVPGLARPFIPIYQDAAAVYGVNPFLLMAVHEDETTYGTSRARGVVTGVNFAGCCAGPMQFSISGGAYPGAGGSGATWGGYRDAYKKAQLPRPASYPNQFSVHPNVYDSYDAIYAAAKYFRELGAGPQLDDKTYQALLRYKGSPPASIPYAQADYTRAKQLAAASAGGGGGGGPALATALMFPVAATPPPASPVASASALERMSLQWPTAHREVISHFGPRWGRLHEGIDIPIPVGTVIGAAGDGTINYRGSMGGYGNYICVRHQPDLATCYAHLSRFGRFQMGAPVKAGDVIAYSGNTGASKGPHLHFEVRTSGHPAVDPAVDPMPYLTGEGGPVGDGSTLASLDGCAEAAPEADPSGIAASDVELTQGPVGELRNGQVLAPADAPEEVKQMIAAGNAIQDLTYVYGGGHNPTYTPTRNGFDCSSTVSYVLHKAGLLKGGPLVSGNFTSWGEPGPGKWVSIYSNNGHMFIVIAGQRLDTGRYGVNKERGPRWRGTAPRPTAGFTVTHPPGL